MKKRKFSLMLMVLTSIAGMGQQVIGSFPQMDGGFESQLPITLTNTTIPNGVPRIDWTAQNNSGTAIVMATGGRSGPKFLSFSATATRKLQSPTAGNMAVLSSTPYTIQFYYKSSATASNGQVGVSTDGTGSPGTYVSVALPNSNGLWTKVTQTASGAVSTANPRYGIGIIRFSGASGATISLDDFVMYAGAADLTPPEPPGSLAFSGISANSLALSWGAASGGTDGGGYVVVRYSVDPAQTDNPNANGIYSTGSVVQGTHPGTVVYSGTSATFTDTGLSPGTTYFYKVYTADKAFNYSPASTGNCSTSGTVMPTVQASLIQFHDVLSNTVTTGWTNGNGSKRMVLINTQNFFTVPLNGSDPVANPVYSTPGEQVVFNGTGNSAIVSGLIPSISYWFRVYEYNGTGPNTVFNTLTVSGNPDSFQTIAVLTSPLIENPVFSTISSESAVLGGTIVSSGGTGITERGTVWDTIPGVNLNNHKLGEGGTTIGVFAHYRTLPAKSKIRFRAYAANTIGTSLSEEVTFFTLAPEPGSHVTGFSGSATGTDSIRLNWNTISPGADGYLILQRPGNIASTMIPEDGVFYPPGSATGDAVVSGNVQAGALPEFVVTGLIPLTRYTFSIIPFAWDGVNPQTINYFNSPVIPFTTCTTLTPIPANYTWTGPGQGDWTLPSNWNPSRDIPVINDNLQFTGGTDQTVINVPGQTVGRISVSGNTTVTLISEAGSLLELRGNEGTGLAVDSGSVLVLSGNKAILLALDSGATGLIRGKVLFDGNTLGTGHKITAAGDSSLVFLKGSLFTAGSKLTGNPFGTGTPNSVIFQNGSTYVSEGGGNPFGLPQPASVSVFQKGSLYKHKTSGFPSVSG